MTDALDMTGRVVLVTGGAKGVGRGIARSFLDAGAKVAICGRNAPDELLVTPTQARADDYNGIVRMIEKHAPSEGFTELGSADRYYHRSDQAQFARLDIPVSFVFAGVHEDYHKPGDTAEKLDYDKVRRVVRLVLRVLDGMQADELDL